MADIAKLGIEVDATGAIRVVRQFGDEAEKTAAKATLLERGVAGLKSAYGMFAGAALGGGILYKTIRETIDAQNSMAQLEARVRSTGGAAGLTVSRLDALSSSLEDVSTYSDEAIKGSEALLLTFSKVKGDTFTRATQDVLDLAAALHTDLGGAAIQVGKALQDPAQGLTALRRSGVSFSDAQQQVIKDLFNTGREAEAQAIILAELEKEFGGSAAAARGTLGGALDYLANKFGNLFEVSTDGTSEVIGAINALGDGLKGLGAHMDAALTAAEAVAVAFGGRWVGGLVAANRETVAMRAQVLLGNAVMLDSVAAQRGAAAAAVESAQVQQTASVQRLAGLKAEEAELARLIALEEEQKLAAQRAYLQARPINSGAPTYLSGVARLGSAQQDVARTGALQAEAQAEQRLIELRARHAAVSQVVTATDAEMTLATTVTTAALARQTEVMAATTLGARAMAGATTLLQGAYALIGGLPGLILIGAYAAYKGIQYLRDDGIKGLDAAVAASDERIKDYRATLSSLGAPELRERLRQVADALERARPQALATGLGAPSAAQLAAAGQYAQLLAQQSAIHDALTPKEAASAAAVAKEVAEKQQAVDKQRALNEAYTAGDTTLKLIAVEHDRLAERQKNAVDHTAAETAALNSVTDAMAAQQRRAVLLADRWERLGDAQRQAAERARAFVETNRSAVRLMDETIETGGRTPDERMIAALHQSREAVDMLVREEAIYQELQRQGITLSDRRYDQARRDAAQKVDNRDIAEQLAAAQQAADAYVKAAGEQRAEQTLQRWKHMLNQMQDAMSGFLQGIFDGTIRTFGDLFDQIKQLFIKLFAELAAMKLIDKLTKAGVFGSILGSGAGGAGFATGVNGLGGLILRGVGGGALAGGILGYGLGQTITSRSGGGILGAAGGGAAGYMLGATVGLGPLGAVAGALAGLAGGILGASEAARRAREQMKAFGHSLADIRAQVAGDTLSQALEQLGAQFDALRQQAREAYAGYANLATAQQKKAELDALEAEAKQKAIEADARQRQQFAEDLRVRLLVAQGRQTEADALRLQLAQQREMQDALANHADAATIELLKQVQAQEALAAATKSLNTELLNVPTGFKMAAAVFRALRPQAPGVGPGAVGPIMPPPNYPRPGVPAGDMTINVQIPLDGKVLASTVVRIGRDGAPRAGASTVEWWKGFKGVG
jgi:hypothetical protein